MTTFPLQKIRFENVSVCIYISTLYEVLNSVCLSLSVYLKLMYIVSLIVFVGEGVGGVGGWGTPCLAL